MHFKALVEYNLLFIQWHVFDLTALDRIGRITYLCENGSRVVVVRVLQQAEQILSGS